MSGLADPMAAKQFWNQFSGDIDNATEIETYDNMMGEYCAIKGIPVEYYTIQVDNYAAGMDPVYAENSRPKWDKKFTFPAILDEFSYETIEYKDMGQLNTDEITLFIHRSTFDKLVGIRSLHAPKPDPLRRGAWGPVARDMLKTIYNGLIYEVLTGGQHFLPSEAQHFGHKFWYKVTAKMREVSDAQLGEGEQYGAFPDIPLDPKYKGNPQFILPTPEPNELTGTGTRDQTGTPPSSGSTPDCDINYTSGGSAPGPGDGSVPADVLLEDGRVADKYQVPGMKVGSMGGDKDAVATVAAEVVSPQTDQVAQPGTPDYNKYGPTGRTIAHSRNLFGDW